MPVLQDNVQTSLALLIANQIKAFTLIFFALAKFIFHQKFIESDLTSDMTVCIEALNDRVDIEVVSFFSASRTLCEARAQTLSNLLYVRAP